MKLPLILLALAAILAFAATLAVAQVRKRRLKRGHIFCNAGFIGTRDRSLTLKAAAVTVGRNRLLKLTDGGTTWTLSGASQHAVAWTPDHAENVGDEIAGRLLGLGQETAIGIASGAITADTDLVSGANGTVKDLPATAGTHWVIGHSILAAADTKEVEYIPCAPRPVVIAS